jgi:uncharacterized heparinase superfamily protein
LRRIYGRPKVLSTTAFPAPRKLSTAAPWLRRPPQGKGGFTFLNLRKDFPTCSIDWRSPEMPKLWRYNLHYFDYLHGLEQPVMEGLRLIDDWIANNPAGVEDAWEPFPVSLRIVNWIKFFIGDGRGQATPERLKSLYRQTLWLERNIEHHLLANHLFKNAKALVFAGVFFEGSVSQCWLAAGAKILQEQLYEQVLADGGHFERSPMYHSMILEDCLDLVNLCRGQKVPVAWALAEQVEPVCRKMMRFLNGLTHPDGRIALFNDAAFGIEAHPAELSAYFKRLSGSAADSPAVGSWSFPNTGYFVMAPRAGDRLIVDCGPVGPDYQPGHSHCDTLSLELSLKGRRVVVDSGCCQYQDCEIRRYNRGNAGHNTVTIDGANQSEVWNAHRCARRAYPLYARLKVREDGSIHFEGAHDGYKRLKGKPVHHRNITWAGDRIAIEDRIEGQGVHEIESRLHIHPDLKVEATGNEVLVSDKGRLLLSVSAAPGQGSVVIESGWYCPEFNKKFNCPVITFKARNVLLSVKFGWKLKLVQLV